MLEVLKMINLMVMEYVFGHKEEYMKVSGSMIKNKEKVQNYGLMVNSIKVNILQFNK